MERASEEFHSYPTPCQTYPLIWIIFDGENASVYCGTNDFSTTMGDLLCLCQIFGKILSLSYFCSLQHGNKLSSHVWETYSKLSAPTTTMIEEMCSRPINDVWITNFLCARNLEQRANCHFLWRCEARHRHGVHSEYGYAIETCCIRDVFIFYHIYE